MGFIRPVDKVLIPANVLHHMLRGWDRSFLTPPCVPGQFTCISKGGITENTVAGREPKGVSDCGRHETIDVDHNDVLEIEKGMKELVIGENILVRVHILGIKVVNHIEKFIKVNWSHVLPVVLVLEVFLRFYLPLLALGL